ncbi:MAG: extracellular solute-binding protein [Rhodocyclaceae bacterium]|nr:extracellular solute-binding protein [Rhodocyclaceae bacterium]
MLSRLGLIVCAILACGTAAGQDLLLRHALEGRAQDALATLVVRFNDEQKGKGRVVLQNLSTVEDRHQLPHMALLDPDDSIAFFGTRPRFRPLHEVMKEAGEKFDQNRLLPQIADTVDDLAGRVQAVPVGLVLPVLYFNQDAFRKAGLDPRKPPATWWEVQEAAGKLFDAGFKCPLTSSRFSWIHLENVSTQHGEPLLSGKGKDGRVAMNSLVNVKHIALLASWQKSFYFHYFGPGREADRKFAAGECAMLTGESVLYSELARVPGFPLGIAELPHYDDIRDARPADLLPDGASVWVLAGRKKEEYRLAARFATFLLRPEVQKEWVRGTGYLPMTREAIDALKTDSAAPELLEMARKRLSASKLGNARTKPGSGRSRVREILNEEIEFVWGNTKPAKEALDTAMRRATDVLRRDANQR